jgi:Holliday junction resolvase RusA-like endonuclease
VTAVATELDLALTIVVRGTPAPMGSKKGFYNKHTGRVHMVESSAKVRPWREAVRSEALAANLAANHGSVVTIDGPIVVDMVFTFTRPKSHYRTGRNAHLLRDDAPPRPDGKPDLDKLLRSTMDALTDAAVWRDDARVVEYGRIAKVYAGTDGDALDAPGAVIRVYPLVQVVTALPQHLPGLFDEAQP